MGIEISHDTISTITDEYLEEMRAWQSRPRRADGMTGRQDGA